MYLGSTFYNSLGDISATSFKFVDRTRILIERESSSIHSLVSLWAHWSYVWLPESASITSLNLIAVSSVYVYCETGKSDVNKVYRTGPKTLPWGTRILFYIMIWDPMFLGDIWSAQNSKTFELCLSVRPSVRMSVCGKHDCVRTQRATDLKIHIGFYYPYAGWYWKWAISVHRMWYLPYKSNR